MSRVKEAWEATVFVEDVEGIFKIPVEARAPSRLAMSFEAEIIRAAARSGSLRMSSGVVPVWASRPSIVMVSQR